MARLSSSFLVSLLILATAACSGGGGGSGGSSGTGSGGGGLGSAGFAAVGGPDGSKLAGVNAPVTIVFSKPVAAASVTSATLRLVTVADTTGQTSTPPGVLASFEVAVIGERVVITPTVEFSSTKVTFGFAADALYEISFGDAGAAGGITSVGGKPLSNPEKTFFFRTPTKALDAKAGYPVVGGYFVDAALETIFPDDVTDSNGDGSLVDEVLALFGADAGDGVLPPAAAPPANVIIPSAPVQDLVFVFDDALIPTSVINTADNSSPAIRVLINIPGQFTFQPIVAPANLTFIHQQFDLTVVAWRTPFVAYPPGALLIVEVGAEVSDVGGNSKFSVTGNNTPLLAAAVNVAGVSDPVLYVGIDEDFDDDSALDAANTAAVWGSPVSDQLVPALGGGRGLDGPFVVDSLATAADPKATQLPLRAVADYDLKTVGLPVVDAIGGGLFEPHVWEFERFELPAGWTVGMLLDRDGDGLPDPDEYLVQSPGHPLDGHAAPLVILSSGLMDIGGTVEVQAVDGEVLAVPSGVSAAGFAAYQAQGGTGGEQPQAGGDGGDGGSVLALRSDGQVAATLSSPYVAPPGQPFDPSDGKLHGATGRSADLQSGGGPGTPVDTLIDGAQALTGFWDIGAPGTLDPSIQDLIDEGKLLLQPNLGIGSTSPVGAGPNSGTANAAIDENHRSFVVTDVIVDDLAGTTSIVVDTSDGGSLVEASDNLGAYPAPAYGPIAAGGDSYLLGPLAGGDGGDDAGFGRGGRGAQPFVVVNAFAIQAAGGGGGGGGGISPGVRGGDSGPEPDPTVNQRATSLGMPLGESAGADGGAGAIRGTGMVIDGTTFDLLTHTAGVDPLDLDGSALVGMALLPNAPSDGWRFAITAVSGGVGQPKSLTLAPIDAVSATIELTSSPAGFSGPGLAPTQVVDYLIAPMFGVGGAGGGGSGVSVTGTLNTSASALPRLTPGAAGGSGGGSIRLETARSFTLRSTGRLYATGGSGGSVPSSQAGLSGGGGGGGGAIEVGAGTSLSLFQGSRISTSGGLGGGTDGQGRGGDGGSGWVRFESFTDNLKIGPFSGLTIPVVGQENLGRLVGEPRSVAQSLFYFAGLANPEVDSVSVSYTADTDGDGIAESGHTWSFDAAGRQGGVGDFAIPPFRFLFNPTTVDSNGFLDVEAASPTFYEAYDLVSGRTGLVFDSSAGSLLYMPGRTATIVHCLSGCGDVALPDLPGVDGFAIDITSMAIGPGRELFLLEQATGRVHVVDLDSGLPLRTITLPVILEGAMTYVADALDPADDRLVFASNRTDFLATLRPSDPDAADPATSDYAPAAPEGVFPVSRDGLALDIEITGLTHDPASNTLWCVDALSGVLFQLDWAPGNQGTSDSTLGHPYVSLQRAGGGVVPSSLAYDGASLQLVVATDPDSTSLYTIAPGSLDVTPGVFAGAPLDLPVLPAIPFLPEVARPIAAGRSYMRFRMTLDGLFDDVLHESGTPVSFRKVAVDLVHLELRNAGF